MLIVNIHVVKDGTKVIKMGKMSNMLFIKKGILVSNGEYVVWGTGEKKKGFCYELIGLVGECYLPIMTGK